MHHDKLTEKDFALVKEVLRRLYEIDNENIKNITEVTSGGFSYPIYFIVFINQTPLSPCFLGLRGKIITTNIGKIFPISYNHFYKKTGGNYVF